jgi:hypothetical protein
MLGEYENMFISFISISDFIANKQASGRSKDLGDIEALQKRKKS